MLRVVSWVRRITKQNREKVKRAENFCEMALKTIDRLKSENEELLKKVSSLEATNHVTATQLEKFKTQVEIHEKAIESLTLVINRDRERITAEIALYSGIAEGTIPVMANVGSRVTSQVSPVH